MSADIWGLFLWVCVVFFIRLCPEYMWSNIIPHSVLWLCGMGMDGFETGDSLLPLNLLILSTNSMLNQVAFETPL